MFNTGSRPTKSADNHKIGGRIGRLGALIQQKSACGYGPLALRGTVQSNFPNAFCASEWGGT